MVEETELDPERALALTYAPLAARNRVKALWRLDERLARLGASPSQFREVKLAWWDEQLAGLGAQGHPEPLLGEVASRLLPAIPAAQLAGLAEAWRALDEDGPLEPHLQARAALFPLTAHLIGASLPAGVNEAARLWARADLRRRRPDLVQPLFATPEAIRWPAPLRSLGALAILALRDLRAGDPEPQGAPRRVARMAWHRLTGL